VAASLDFSDPGHEQDNIPDRTVGVDYVLGETGDDTIIGSRAHDWILGGSGSDTIYHSAGDDRVNGGTNARQRHTAI
jgi:Ca2+-binding RTX toxin-like protein